MPQDNTVIMEGVRLVFRNFTGKEGPYNQEGQRSFGAVIPDRAVAEQMLADDWNVKQFDVREEDEGEEGDFWIPVKMKWDGVRPPRIVLITSRGKTNLSESEVSMLDGADITNVDLIIRPYAWSQPDGRSGVSAYLQSMYVTIEEDPLEKKYAELDPQ